MKSATHFTLHPGFNALLIVLEGFGVFVVSAVDNQMPVLTMFVGVIAGIVIGILQLVSIRRNIGGFVAAETALDIRKILGTTNSGNVAILLQWATAVLLVVIALSQGSVSVNLFWSFLNVFWDFLAGYLSLMFSRELFTFPALLWITQAKRNIN